MSIALSNVSAKVGSFMLQDVSFEIPDGAYGVVIGPAGSGKTTLLETIAGILPLQSGDVRLSGRDAARLPPEQRDVGFVYQHGYLFPHLSVMENIAYGARDAEAARDAADRMGATALLHRHVRTLSGGERQLVALARAIARRPRILLLDEPFGALDPKRRASVRREIRALHREHGLTALQVTHDFTEAGLLGDVAVLLDAGRVLQSGPPEQLFRAPASPYIAEFLDAENVLAGTVRRLADDAPDWLASEEVELADGYHPLEFNTGELRIYAVGSAPAGDGYAVIRAEEILLSFAPQKSSARNQFRGHVSEIVTLGALTRVTVQVGKTPLVAALTTRSVREMQLAIGVEVTASFKAMAVHLC